MISNEIASSSLFPSLPSIRSCCFRAKIIYFHIRKASCRIYLEAVLFMRLCRSCARTSDGCRASERSEREIVIKLHLSLVMAFSRLPSFHAAPLAYLLVFSISIPDSRFSKLVFNIQNEILIKSNLPIPSEYISRNDKI